MNGFLNTGGSHPENIVHCRGRGADCILYLNDGKKRVIKKTLKAMAVLFPEQQFIRVHRSHFVNIAFINRFVKGAAEYLLLHDGTAIPVSKKYRKQLISISGQPQ